MTDNQTEQFIVKLKLYVRASYPLLWVQTHEETRVINDIALAFDSLKIPIPVYAWDVQQELRKYQKSNDDKKINWLQIPQPLTPPKTDIMGIIKYCSMLPRIGNGRTLIIIKDFHPYIEVAQQVRAIRNLVDTAHAADQTYIFVSPVIKIPIELEKDFQLLDYKLPNDAQLGQILQSLTKDFIAAYPANEEIHSVPRAIELDIIEACKGMTFAESYDACALAAATHGKFNSKFVSTVFEEKIKQVKRHGFIQYLKPTDTFDSIGGLSELKTWIKVRAKAYTEEARKYGLKYPRGILLAGIPGTGKSMIAKATANELGFPLFQLDVGSLFGKFIGQTEENFRKVIETMDGIGRCVLYIDEVEKSINRDAVSGAGDSGTSSRSFATLLTWLSDHETPVFLIATSNNHLRLPPEFLRKGRFDELWWLDLPTEVERQEIFSVLLTKNNRDTTKYDLKKLAKEATDLTGAEIENVIVSAMFDRFALDGKEITTTNLMDEINKTMPFAKTAAEDLAKMRETAKGKLRTATSSGIVKTLEANRTRSVDLANLSM